MGSTLMEIVQHRKSQSTLQALSSGYSTLLLPLLLRYYYSSVLLKTTTSIYTNTNNLVKTFMYL